MSEPRATRPHMPGYGIDQGEEGLLPWSWARERLTRARNYFVATVRPDGRPHVMPVWGVWMDDVFYFSSSAGSRKARNLASDGRCVVAAEGADEAAIVEGIAGPLTDRETLLRMIDVYNEKYDWKMDPDEGPFFAVRPRTVFGFIEREEQFPRTATRWTFEA